MALLKSGSDFPNDEKICVDVSDRILKKKTTSSPLQKYIPVAFVSFVLYFLLCFGEFCAIQIKANMWLEHSASSLIFADYLVLHFKKEINQNYKLRKKNTNQTGVTHFNLCQKESS